MRAHSTVNVSGCRTKLSHALRAVLAQDKFLLALPFCRINAAFHLATEGRIFAAAKNSVVRPGGPGLAPRGRTANRPGSQQVAGRKGAEAFQVPLGPPTRC